MRVLESSQKVMNFFVSKKSGNPASGVKSVCSLVTIKIFLGLT